MRHRLYDWLRRHPYVFDGALTGLLLLFSAEVYFDPDGAEGLLTMGLLAPLLWRRRYPELVFTVISLGCLLQLLTHRMPLPADIGFLFALYAVSAYSPRQGVRFAALAVGGFGSLVGTLAWSMGTEQIGAMVGMMASTVALAWTLGDLLRTRRAYVGQLEERAKRLEFERDQQAQLVRAAERARIAREVHDVIAHSLSIVIAQADGGSYAAKQNPAAATDALATIADTGRHALSETRWLLNVLRTTETGQLGAGQLGAGQPGAGQPGAGQPETGQPGTGEPGEPGSGSPEPEGGWAPQPDLSRIDELADRFRAAGLPIELVVNDLPPRASPGLELAAYRIVQEALTNTLKHGGPEVRAVVSLATRSPGGADAGRNAIRIHVTDDGRGAAALPGGQGHGLAGMRERAALYGGTLRAGPRSGGGFEVVGELPYPY